MIERLLTYDIIEVASSWYGVRRMLVKRAKVTAKVALLFNGKRVLIAKD